MEGQNGSHFEKPKRPHGGQNGPFRFTLQKQEYIPPSEQVHKENIVYKATVTTRNTKSTKHYTGMSANTCKERYRDRIKSFQNKNNFNDTKLSKYIWN